MNITLKSVLIFSLAFSLVSANQRIITVLPQETDMAMQENHIPHYCTVNRNIPSRNTLLLFLPGTNSSPARYSLFANTAADLGFHVIILNYPNAVSVNEVCKAKKNTNSFRTMRLEIIEGKDYSPYIAIPTNECINNRLTKLLWYLSHHYPLDGWEQFMKIDGTPKWASFIVGGHSQGGGHAAMLAQLHTVKRAIIVASADYSLVYKKPAPWTTKTGKTPSKNLYYIGHSQDRTVPFSTQLSMCKAYGTIKYGARVNVDTSPPPYRCSHTLFSSTTPAKTDAQGTTFHNAIICNDATPRLHDGTPVFTGVWKYLLTGECRPSGK